MNITMENEKRKTMIPAYIAYAIILLTANHLRCEVKMLDTAKEVWQTKRMPESIQLGMYEKAAHEAILLISDKGLSEKADYLGEIFYMTGEFPKSLK